MINMSIIETTANMLNQRDRRSNWVAIHYEENIPIFQPQIRNSFFIRTDCSSPFCRRKSILYLKLNFMNGKITKDPTRYSPRYHLEF